MKSAIRQDRSKSADVQPATAPVGHEILPRTIDFLGGEAVMKRRIESKIDVHDFILAGFPNGVIAFLVKSVPELKNPRFLQKAIGMSLRTSQRKSAVNDLLTTEQSSKAWNFAEVMAQASIVFGSKEVALEWLNRPAMGLDGKMPIDLLSTSAGNELVRDFLTRLEYGVYA